MRPNDIIKLKIFVNCWRASCYLPGIPNISIFSTIIDCAISLQRYACFLDFLFLSWHNVKRPHNAELWIGLRTAHLTSSFIFTLGSLREKLSCINPITHFLEFYAKKMIKKIGKNQFWNSRLSVILTNLVRKTQKIVVLKWMRYSYFQISLKLNEPAR